LDTLDAWLARLEAVHRGGMVLGLERVAAVAARLKLRFPCPVFVVGGTNGKGSSCAMLESILSHAGYRVALYTSPHLVRFNERARFGQQALVDAELVDAFGVVEAARQGVELSYFEFTTLAILQAFMRRGPDVLVAEVGLGGRLDAVNLLDADCAIVTSIDIDHAQWLGDTREKIAWEKAHIFRSGRPAVCSDPAPPATLIDYADAVGADLYCFGRDFNYAGDRQQWSCAVRGKRRAGLAYPALRGANQLLNASGVLAALDAMRQRLPVPAHAIRQGLALVELPGRFQVLPGRPAIVLDVAHNPHAVGHLAANLDQMGFFPETYAVVGMLADKDVHSAVQRIASRIQFWLPCSLPGPRGLDARTFARKLAGAAADAKVIDCFERPAVALDRARQLAQDDDRIVVFGSFLTVSDALQGLGRN
jgi:dihydrofolate synthase/folylpolyglutamate synthase